MTTGFDLKIEHGDYLNKSGLNPVLKKAMDAARQGWHDEITRYPTQAEGVIYKRTHSLGNTATSNVAKPTEAELIGRFYGEYVLKGTKKWQGWPGKLDQIKKRCIARYKAAFKAGLT